jgi:3-methyladenine DNA glycosylase AlkD
MVQFNSDLYVNKLTGYFESARNTVRAEKSKHYVKDKFDFIGLDAKTLRQQLKEFLAANGNPPSAELGNLSRALFAMNEREYQNAAIEIIRYQTKHFIKSDIEWIEEMIVTKSWWDSVDGVAVFICGDYFKLFPGQIIPVTGRWINSENIWLKRSAIIFQLKYKSATDTELLDNYIRLAAGHKDFFVRKAIGWILREYSKKHPDWVKAFVANNSLSGLSYREATKYI